MSRAGCGVVLLTTMAAGLVVVWLMGVAGSDALARDVATYN